MMFDQQGLEALYKRLLSLYPQGFRERLGESMEQSFRDLCKERTSETDQSYFSFVLWIFIETAAGIFRERLLLITEGDSMQTVLRTLGSSGVISFLLILPFMIMEVVNRRHLNEDFPNMLFFVLWLNLFAVSLILLPIVRARRRSNHDVVNPIPIQGNTLLTSPKSTAIISISLFLFPGVFPLLNSLGWLSMDRLFNGPNPEVAYLPGQILSLGLILFPITAGIIAGRPIVNKLWAGGNLFSYPIHLIIVVVISFLFAAGVVGLIADQWPCFIGVPNCD